MKQAKTTRHPRPAACDANMRLEDFEKSLWFPRETMHVVASEEAVDMQVERPKKR